MNSVIFALCVVFFGDLLAYPVTFHHDFRSGKLPSSHLSVSGRNAENLISTDENGILLHFPNGTPPEQFVAIESKFRLRGDFEVTARFQIDEFPKQGSRTEAGISLELI